MKIYQISLSFLAFFLVLFSSFVIKLLQTPSYDHLQLVFTWPNTFCLNKSVSCKIPVPQKFMVHGLWPADKDGKILRKCTPKRESLDKILDKYEEQLKKSWLTLRSDITNRLFWKREWYTHGVCVKPRLNVTQYLQLIISLESRFNLMNALTANNMAPNNCTYKRSKVDESIYEQTQGNPFYISCLNHEEHTLINEVYICLDWKGQNVVSCPPNNNPRNCSWNKDLVFPSNDTRECGQNEDLVLPA